MRIEAIIWSLTCLYYAGLGIIYVALSGEPAGTAILLVAAAFGGLVAGWLWHQQRRGVILSADVANSDAADDVGEIGDFTTDSIRPLALAMSFVIVWLGVVLGLWLTGVGLAMAASQIALIVRDADPA